MVIRRSDGNVGIGNTNPNFKLDVNGNSRIGSTSVEYTGAVGANHNLVLDALNYSSIGFHDSGSTIGHIRFSGIEGFEIGRADGAFGPHNTIMHGNVGIGTTSPGAKLDVNGNTNITGNLTVTNLINKPTADSVVITQNDVPILSTFKATGTDGENTFIGRSGNTTLTGSTTSTQGSYNTAIGQGALTSLTVGFQNVAVGNSALKNNTEGYQNVAVGQQALRDNNTGYFNTAVGQEALRNNTSGTRNTAMGLLALSSNTTGQFNTSVGVVALTNNTSGN
jgi:hypothetical protein